jgi:hypothetical protein
MPGSTAGELPAVPDGPFSGAHPVQNAVQMLSLGMWTSRMLQTAAELGVADAMPADGGASVAELAELTGTNPDALGRLLRGLSASGIFAPAEEGRYVHTERSLVLREDHPQTLHYWARVYGSHWMWASCAGMTEAVRTGRAAFPAEFHRPVWAYLENEPAQQWVFQQGMAEFTRLHAQSLADALEVGDARTVADIGGGQGSVLRAVLHRHPHLDGVLFENKSVLDALRGGRSTVGFRLVAGDASEAVDCPADIYLLGHFVHLFEDDGAVRVLANCAAAAPPGARIIAMERVIADGPKDTFGKVVDLLMFCYSGGRERTEDEYHALFERAGLTWAGITPTASDMSLIEGIVRAEPPLSPRTS